MSPDLPQTCGCGRVTSRWSIVVFPLEGQRPGMGGWLVAFGLVVALGGAGSVEATGSGPAVRSRSIGSIGRPGQRRLPRLDLDHCGARAGPRLVARRLISAIDASWAPGGGTVAFVRDCSMKYSLTCSSVWRMSANGGGLRKLSDGQAQDFCPAWSPDGDGSRSK